MLFLIINKKILFRHKFVTKFHNLTCSWTLKFYEINHNLLTKAFKNLTLFYIYVQT